MVLIKTKSHLEQTPTGKNWTLYSHFELVFHCFLNRSTLKYDSFWIKPNMIEWTPKINGDMTIVRVEFHGLRFDHGFKSITYHNLFFQYPCVYQNIGLT